MAQRRMFSKKITNTDQFLDLPLSSQALYFHLNMNADDDGFVNNVRSIIRLVGASNDDFKLLVAKQFVITFNDGITVIRDWRIHNYIQKDRRQPTLYKEELKQLGLDENNRYIKDPNHVSNLDTECIQPVSTGKVRLGKVSKDIDKDSKEDKRSLAKESAKDKKAPCPKHKKRVYDKDSDYYKLSEFFISQIKKNNPNFKDPNIQKWSDDLRKIVEIDKRDKHGVAMLIKWVQKDSFWMSNVLSPAKLREKYDQLIMRMNNSSEPHVLNQVKPSKPKSKIDSKKKDELLKQARERDQKFIKERNNVKQF